MQELHKGLRFEFITELDEKSKQTALLPSMRPDYTIKRISIDPYQLRRNGDDSFHAIEVTRDRVTDGWGWKHHVVRVRVIADADEIQQGINIVIPCDTELQIKKYLDLRNQIRNTDRVMVRFLDLQVSPSKGPKRSLYFSAQDYKIVQPIPRSIQPQILI
jgi:hypothetical protein